MATANRNCFGSPGIKQEPRDYGYDLQKGKIHSTPFENVEAIVNWGPPREF